MTKCHFYIIVSLQIKQTWYKHLTSALGGAGRWVLLLFGRSSPPPPTVSGFYAMLTGCRLELHIFHKDVRVLSIFSSNSRQESEKADVKTIPLDVCVRHFRFSDLQTTLSVRVLFIHDSLLLGSLLLLPACLGCLLTLSVSLLQEVLLHTGTVSVSFLFALNIQRG